MMAGVRRSSGRRKRQGGEGDVGALRSSGDAELAREGHRGRPAQLR
jgi:hypothetical protein